jgi:hypothetical protein
MLNIITPCKRLENLKQVSKSIPVASDILWILVLDYERPIPIDIQYNGKLMVIYGNYNKCNWGHFQRNLGINYCQPGHIYFLDDDTILHPEVYKQYKMIEGIKLLIIGNQYLKNGRLRFKVILPPKIGNIDIASALIPLEFAQDIQLNYHYEADGEWFIKLYEKYTKYMKLIIAPMSYYNYLR